jgi:predicted GNAT superfamily acetyltransferase
MHSELPFTIRDLHTSDDLRAFEALQKEIWGDQIGEVITSSLASIAQKIGGIAAGAFDSSGVLIGLVFGFTGYRNGLLVHWSHMLAVKDPWRDSGIGKKLKLYQREKLLKIGVDEVYWTFDPLVARNAFFNFHHLGVSASEYAIDMYGPGDDSELFRGIGTDRLIVVWKITKDYIKAVLEGRLTFDARPYVSAPFAVVRTVESDPFSQPLVNGVAGEERLRIEIPPDIHLLRDKSPGGAKAWREATRDAFVQAFAKQYEIAGFSRDNSSGRCFYCLCKAR